MTKILLLGQTNAGKSTIFNGLVGTKTAVTDPTPNTTLDYLSTYCKLNSRCVVELIDPAGIGNSASNAFLDPLEQHTWLQAESADLIIYIGRKGCSISQDQANISLLRKKDFIHKTHFIINSEDHNCQNIDNFSQLGLTATLIVNGKSKTGISDLAKYLSSLVSDSNQLEAIVEHPKIAIVGKPNAGKSSLLNKLLGFKRTVVSDQLGTTRDVVSSKITINNKDYMLLDSPGDRSNRNAASELEKNAIANSKRLIRKADIIVLLIDANSGITTYDSNLMSKCYDLGKILIIGINKYDLLNDEQKEHLLRDIKFRTRFISDQLATIYLSAKTGFGLNKLKKVITGQELEIPVIATSKLNEILRHSIAKNPPPYCNGRRIKLKFAHQETSDRVKIVIHGNQTHKLPNSYKKYLKNCFIKELNLKGYPLFLNYKTEHNPFSERGSN